MSYTKMMKHATNPNIKKGRNQYMGFDVSSSKSNRIDVISDLFKYRNGGFKFHKSKEFMRDCIRRHIKLLKRGDLYV